MVINKLICSFTKPEHLDDFIENIKISYTLLYNRIFVLHTDGEEYVCTYNLDLGNINTLPADTITVHRKKETNTLYSINALNELIKQLNNGFLDKNFTINWTNYKNSILLSQNCTVKKINTKLYKVIFI